VVIDYRGEAEAAEREWDRFATSDTGKALLGLLGVPAGSCPRRGQPGGGHADDCQRLIG